MGLANVAAAAIVPGAVAATARRQVPRNAPPADAEPRLLAAWTTSRTIRLALLEGAAFLAGIVYFSEGSAVVLALSLALVLAVAAQFPSRAGLEAWLDRQWRLHRDGSGG